MAKRLAEGDRVRSVYMTDSRAVATTVTEDGVLTSYTFQDDVTVIGCEVCLNLAAVDAHLNADLMIGARLELTRQALRQLPGALARCDLQIGWTAAITTGGGLAKNVVVMFPKGKGVEIDEGEVINLLGLLTYVGAGGTLTIRSDAIVFYTER